MSADVSVKATSTQVGVMRRFGAMLYDTLIVIALLMATTGLLLTLTGGEAITSERFGALELVYQLVLLAVIVGFFGGFWTRRGQTLGMRAWRLRVLREDGRGLSWMDSLKRMAAALLSLAPLGLGYFWAWIDRDKLTWHDRLTHTRVILLPKE